MIVSARPTVGAVFKSDSFADLTPFEVRSVRWTEGGLIRVDFDDDLDDGGPMSADDVAAVKRRISGDVAEFDPSTADLAATKAALADLIRLFNGDT